ncbi:synaptopodin-2 [Pleurodeles waltl]|uniref:synaptopodin-2 n=1 Tax=Pleurodeles waltl TaxID=8319 RepID=UPI0037096107
MGTGDYISIALSGGSPWGFRLDGGLEQNLPLTVSQIRSPSKAEKAGLCVGDEVITINGNPCLGLPYSRVVTFISSSKDILRMLIKRPASETNEILAPTTEDTKCEDVKPEEYTESTTLQIRSEPQSDGRGLYISDSKDTTQTGAVELVAAIPPTEQESEETLVYKITPKVVGTTREYLVEQPPSQGEEEGRKQGTVVELQLSLSHGSLKKGADAPLVSLLEAESHSPSEAGLGAQPDKPDNGSSLHHNQPEESGHHITKTFRFDGGGESTAVPGDEVASRPLTKVEVILACSDREKEASQAPADRGSAVSGEEGGQPVAPPSGLPLGISSDGTEQEEEDEQSGKDHSRPHKHRARHARLRRSESLSEKKVKEAKSKCKSIALLLTQAPTPSSKGVLMFKKRRQRAKKYTLVSYGTGELEPEEPDEEDNEGDEGNTYELTLLGTSESEIDEDFFSDPEKKAQIVTFDWDTGLLEVEKSKGEATMESLPETKGKGALMFARRKQRMDEITAEQEDMNKLMQDSTDSNMAESVKQVVAHQSQHSESTRTQSCVSKSYIEVSHSQARVQNGISGTQEATSSFQSSEVHRLSSSNRSAKPFGGVQNRAAVPFSPTRNVTSPFSDRQTPPPYSSISPLPEPLYKVSSPVAGIAQPNVWSPYESMEQIASRDERISVPAKKTGILQDAKKRSTAKPMFTFKEPPKVDPNPALLSLVQTREGKRGTGLGNESGPEEDYLSLGAEACNFMQAQAAKQKNPPPVAPKPAAKSSPAPTTPVAAVWAPPSMTSSAAPPFPTTHISQVNTIVPVNIAKPATHSYQPPDTHHMDHRGPQAAEIVNQTTHTPKTPPTMPLGNVALAGGVGPSFEMPALQGRGAELFAKRQSRMEKFVVDSETVQANMARASSPTPSLPPSWKYSSNVRAPPPLAYNPTQSPLYPLAASKSQPLSANTTSKNIKKKPKKALNALDVMKHQPYQLNASLFTFQPPSDAKSDLAPKQPGKSNFLPPLKQAQPARVVNHAPSANYQAASLYSEPTYNQQPSFQSNAATSSYESSAPGGYPMLAKQESTATPLIAPPRPKFSAKKVGASAQERDGGVSFSLPGRRSAPADLRRVASPTSPLVFHPSPGYSSKPETTSDITGRRLTPWEAAAKSPYGLVDDAFEPLTMQESIAANVVSAARRKTLPEPPLAWKQRVSYGVSNQNLDPNLGTYGRNQLGVTSPTKSIFSAPGSTLTYGSQIKYPFYSRRSATDPNMASLDTQSEYGISSAPTSNFTSYPRAWRR